MSRLNHALAFVARAVIAGLALAFVVVYLWPAVEERLRPAEIIVDEDQSFGGVFGKDARLTRRPPWHFELDR